MKVLAYPRDDGNPYQRLLYGEMEKAGVKVRFPGRLTPSHTLNLVLIPAELAVLRVSGYRVFHLHWVHGFGWTGAGRFPVLRRVAQAWFGLCLAMLRLLRIPLVWTVHNVLPHEPVFADDMAARRRLVRQCDLVIAHTRPALSALADLGLVPRRAVVIPHGSLALAAAPSTPAPDRAAAVAARQFLFFGRILEYKGVEDLLTAFAGLPGDAAAQLTVAGECGDPRLRAALTCAANTMGSRVTLLLDRVPESRVAALLAAADVVVLPFRRVTTSGSAMLALGHGRPLIVPDLDALDDLPAAAVVRYGRAAGDLGQALAALAVADDDTLAKMSAAALAYAESRSWQEIAASTARALREVLEPG